MEKCLDKQIAIVDLAPEHALKAADSSIVQLCREYLLIVKPGHAQAGNDFPYESLQRHVIPAIPRGIS
jgi:hypothetical protein